MAEASIRTSVCQTNCLRNPTGPRPNLGMGHPIPFLANHSSNGRLMPSSSRGCGHSGSDR